MEWDSKYKVKTTIETVDGTVVEHTRDEQCVLDEYDTCILCGVQHRKKCYHCGKRGFHHVECKYYRWTNHFGHRVYLVGAMWKD